MIQIIKNKIFKKYISPDYRFSLITDNLATGSRLAALSPPPPITAILNVAEEIIIKDCKLAYKKVPIKDLYPMPVEQLKEALQWIDLRIKENRAILVSCNAGIGRSTSIVVAYLYCFEKMGFGEAIEFIAKKNPNITILPCLISSIEVVRDALGA